MHFLMYYIEVIVPPEDDAFTAPDPKKRKLDVQLAGWFASSVIYLVVLITYCLAEFIAFILRVGVVYPAYTILANHIHCTNVP